MKHAGVLLAKVLGVIGLYQMIIDFFDSESFGFNTSKTEKNKRDLLDLRFVL
jgi:hypothetical protein